MTVIVAAGAFLDTLPVAAHIEATLAVRSLEQMRLAHMSAFDRLDILLDTPGIFVAGPDRV